VRFLKSSSHRYLLTLAVGFFLVLAADQLGFTEGMNHYCYDLFFRLRGTVEPDRRILIVAIDEQTLSRLGRWPLRRGHYARLLDAVGPSAVVGLDILMAEPTGDDPLLAESIARHGRVVLPVSVEHPFQTILPSGGLDSDRVGHVYLEQDVDGVVRSVYHTLHSGGRAMPSFASAIHDLLGGERLRRQDPPVAAGERWRRPDLLQQDGQRINYCGPPGTFPRLSMIDILDGRYPSAYFTNRIVLVGVTAAGLEGGVLTPFTQLRTAMSGVEAHATILNNLTTDNAIVTTAEPARLALSLCAALAGFFLFSRLGARRMLFCCGLGLAAVWLTSLALFAWLDFWFSPILLSLMLLVLLVCSQLNRLERSAQELREAQDDWEDSFNTIADGILLEDAGGAVIRMNQAARSMQGAGLLEQLARAPLSGSGEEVGGQGLTRELVDPLSGNCYEIRSLARSDHPRGEGGIVHVIRDVTARKKMEQEKELLQFQFLQSQKMESVGRLAGGVAHDFNNILTAILGYSEIARLRATHDEKLSECLDIIHDSGMKAASLVRQLLIFSRKSTLEPQVVDIRSLIDNMAKILGRVIGEDVILRLQTDSPVRNILVDPAQVEQIIMNLVVNARDAMPQGGTVTIRAEDVELDSSYTCSHLDLVPGPYVMLSVRDTGMGMSPEVRARIFEPFFTTKQVGEGTGLGLSTVYGIVKQMAGHIYVYSEPGRGSEFKVYFPVCRESIAEVGPEVEEAVAGGSETILVVEDDASILTLITSLLEPLGYVVLAAHSGDEALLLAERSGKRIDLLLTDVVMPGMGGRTLAGLFLERYPAARVVFMSGYTDDIIIRQGVSQGQCAFVQKPISPRSLTRKLRDVLDGQGREGAAPPVPAG
jgi:signal transduction histidine kinase/ActR/RegA family two-component response regulator